MCNFIEDPASLVNAQLSDRQPTCRQLVRRSNGATPTYGSVHLVATLDVRIHGFRLRSAAPTAGIGSPTKIGFCASADGALLRLLAHIEVSQAQNR